MIGRGVDFRLTADERRAFPHADQAESGAAVVRRGLGRTETASVVLDDQYEVAVMLRQRRMPCVGVFGDVV